MKAGVCALLLLALCARAYTQLSVVHNFTGLDGYQAKGQLLLTRDGALAGYTAKGGLLKRGSVFRVDPDGADFRVLHRFLGVYDSYEPHHASLQELRNGTLVGCNLYGPNRVRRHSSHDVNTGSIFFLDPDGSNYRAFLLSRSEGAGYKPHSGPLLAQVGAHEVLYGSTSNGGVHGGGTLWLFNVTSQQIAYLYSFETSTGKEMHARVTLDSSGTCLYGMTKSGGDHNGGVLFRFNLTTRVYTPLLHLSDATGYEPRHGYLVRVNQTMFGLTSLGGKGGLGTVLAIDESGANVRVLHHFCCTAGGCASSRAECTFDGCMPYAEPIYLTQGPGAGFLYANTRNCGAHDRGTIFRVRPNGSDYSVVANFSHDLGQSPIGGLAAEVDQSALYGTTETGGSTGNGVVFSFLL